MERGKCDAVFDGCHSARVLCLDADLVSGFVISGSKDKTLNVWQLDSRVIGASEIRPDSATAKGVKRTAKAAAKRVSHLYGGIKKMTLKASVEEEAKAPPKRGVGWGMAQCVHSFLHTDEVVCLKIFGCGRRGDACVALF